MDLVFRALADDSRRALLDSLCAQGGQTLAELCSGLDMSRQAVSKHLTILEEANLVATIKNGREKLHYLNAVPIAEYVTMLMLAHAKDYRAVVRAQETVGQAVEGAQPEAGAGHAQQRLDARKAGWTVVNAGVSGDTSAGGLRRLDRLARAQTALSLGLWLGVIICGRWIAYVPV